MKQDFSLDLDAVDKTLSAQIPPRREETITFDQLFAEIEVRLPVVQNRDNREIMASVSDKVKEKIKSQEGAYFVSAENSAKQMTREYCIFFDTLMNDSTLYDPVEFCNRASERTELLNSPVLKTVIKVELLALVTKNGQHYKEVREKYQQQRLEQRENITAKALTMGVYLLALDLFSSLIPGSPVNVNPGIFMTILLGAVGNFATTGYKSPSQAISAAQRISDRVIANPGLSYCYTTAGNLVQYVSVGLANRANQVMARGGAPQAEPPTSNKVKIKELN